MIWLVKRLRVGEAITHTIDLSRSLGGSRALRLEAVGDGFRYTTTRREADGRTSSEKSETMDDEAALRAFLLERRDVLQFVI